MVFALFSIDLVLISKFSLWGTDLEISGVKESDLCRTFGVVVTVLFPVQEKKIVLYSIYPARCQVQNLHTSTLYSNTV